MSKDKLPKAVPLPEVPHYTEDIIFGGLGFPVGFDQSSLIVNLRHINRIRSIAGLQVVSMFATGTNDEPLDMGISNIDDQGTATVGFAAKRHKKPIQTSSLDYGHSLGPFLGQPDLAIKVNNTELEKRIEETDKYPKGVFDSKARAKFLNKALKRGLADASFEASFSKFKVALSASFYPLGFLASHSLVSTSSERIIGTGNFGLIDELFAALMTASLVQRSSSSTLSENLKSLRLSLFMGATPDRFIAASALLSTKKVIEAKV
jgi:hypothetical protein